MPDDGDLADNPIDSVQWLNTYIYIQVIPGHIEPSLGGGIENRAFHEKPVGRKNPILNGYNPLIIFKDVRRPFLEYVLNT